jgi:polyisoprenyl-phosphate glycosyltransferase
MILRWKADNLFKRPTASLFYRFLNSLTDVPLPNDVGDFRLVDRKVCECLNGLGERHRCVRGLARWLGFRQDIVDYVREPRWAGTMKHPVKKMLSFAVDAITSFSNRPLRVASYLGALISLAGFVYLLVMLLRKLFGFGMVEGRASLMSITVGFCGLIILVLGLPGEYLGRVFDEVKGRPLYVISRTLDGSRAGERGRKASARGDRKVKRLLRTKLTTSPRP